MRVYDLIEDVLRAARKPLTEFEFADVQIAGRPENDGGPSYMCSGRRYVGCTESTLGRRLREMREKGRVTSKRREGKQFMEYALVKQTAEFPAETVAA